ncbi:hypothetical protein GQ53DRAFT_507199 [Thozetella sp. PMI_491]|nr:hypothetical protein GQ53DRAFT_507199 [Thozetella sp. PMI_491]
MRRLYYLLPLLGGFLRLGASAPLPPSILPRDGADVNPLLTAVMNVAASVATLDNAIIGLASGNIAALLSLVQRSNEVQQSLASATSTAEAVNGMLNASDVDILSDRVKSLVAVTQSTISDLMAQQPLIAAAGGTNTTLNVLTGQKTAATNFANALQVKLPSSKQQMAAGLASEVVKVFDGGIAAFSAKAPVTPTPAAAPTTPSPAEAPTNATSMVV